MFLDTDCDKEKIKRVFTEDFVLHRNYSFFNKSSNLDVRASKLFLRDASFVSAKPSRLVSKGIYSAETCILACITEKEFVCFECDYFKSDGGVCALYNLTGNYGNTFDPLFVGFSRSSDHYRLYKGGRDVPPPCNISGRLISAMTSWQTIFCKLVL